MPARRYPKSGDPRLKTKSYRAIVAHWQNLKPEQCQAPRCLLPGVAIRYTLPRTSASLDVGHLTPRETDTRQVWQISDTRPEHQRCNRAAGVAMIRARGRGRTRATNWSDSRAPGVELAITSDEW